MRPGARTPEELETLLEDAFVMRDRAAVVDLFEPDGLVATRAMHTACGAAIGPFVAELWAQDLSYLARTERVLQARDTALIIAERAISVVRRRDDHWRYSISLLHTQQVERRHTAMSATNTTATDAANARWWFNALAVIKAGAADTGGQLTIVEVTEPPNAEAPLHVHHREDEGFLVLEGRVTLYVGDDIVEAGPGDFGWGPRDIPHRYVVGPEGCRMLFLCTPGGFENLVIGMSAPAASLTLPPPSDQEPDWDHVAAVGAANGCELLA